MRRPLLFAYQLLTGSSDTATGFLLVFAPAWTLRLMMVHVPADALPFLSYIGVFVLSVGIACLYGAVLACQAGSSAELAVVWLLTAVTRGLVAIFLSAKIAAGGLEPAWATVAFTDGAFALLQAFGLARGWLRRG